MIKSVCRESHVHCAFKFPFLDERINKQMAQMDMEEMIENLKDDYKVTEKLFYSAEWMENCLQEEDIDHMFVNLVYVKDSDLGRTYRQQKEIETEEIYDMYDSFCKFPDRKKFLWIADAGMGKTTACKKIVIDWCQNSAIFHRHFPGVNLVIFLRCRDIEIEGRRRSTQMEGRLLRSIAKLLLPEPIDENVKKQLFKYLKDSASELLFVIDGIDELQEIDTEIDHLLRDKLFRGSNVIATSRREGLKGCKKYFSSSVFEIIGFTRKGVEEFVEKYFKADQTFQGENQINAASLLIKVNHDETLKELSRNPLCLLILCVVWEDKGEDLPGRRYDLYDCFLQIIVKRIVDKNSDKYAIISYHRNLISLLGKLAYDTLKTNKTSFSYSDLEKNSLTTGIDCEIVNCSGLVRIDKSGKKKALWYEFFHKTFQEFFASLYVAQQFRYAEKKEKESICIEFQWLLKLLPCYTAQTFPRSCSCEWAFPVVMSFLCGSLDIEDMIMFFQYIFIDIARLQVNKWCCWRGVTCPFIEELSPQVVTDSASILADVIPSLIDMETLAYMAPENRLHFVKGPMRNWSLTRQYSHLCLSCSLSETDAESLDEILRNESSQIRTLEVITDRFSDCEIFQRLAEKFWTTKFEVLNLNFARKRYDEVHTKVNV